MRRSPPLLLAVALLAAAAIAVPDPSAAQLAPIGGTRGKGEGGATARRNEPFRLGIVADRREAATARVEPFRAQLGAVVGRPVTVTVFAEERDLVAALAGGRIDYAPLSAIGFATATRLCDCVEPLAAPRDADRTPGWYAVVVARADGAIARVEDLAGRRLAVAPATSIGTRRLPLAALGRIEALAARPPVPVETEGPAAALRALLDGRADAAVVWSSLDGDRDAGFGRGTLADSVARGEMRGDDVRVVWSSPQLPLGPHTVRAALAEPVKRRLREMLIQLDADPETYEAIERTHSGGFVRVGAPSYRPFVDLLTPPDAAPAEPAPPDAPPADGAPTTTGTPRPRG